MASQQVAGAQAKGVYAFMKHFALNDQETNRLSELATWANEQSIREIYLKPFEMSVKQGGAGAVMSAFNYIGMEWGGSHSGLLNTVLRGEWGFRGMVLTIMKYLKRRKLAAAASAPADAPVVPEFLRTLVFARPRGDDQFADCTFSPSLDMSR